MYMTIAEVEAYRNGKLAQGYNKEARGIDTNAAIHVDVDEDEVIGIQVKRLADDVPRQMTDKMTSTRSYVEYTVCRRGE